MSEVLQTLAFTVPRKAVSVNQAYVRARFGLSRGAGGGKGLVLSSAGRDFKDCCRAHAFVAARTHAWPKPDTVRRVTLHITAFNSRHDADAPAKLTADALEDVIYRRDNVVETITCRKAKDGGKPRIEVVVDLLEVA